MNDKIFVLSKQYNKKNLLVINSVIELKKEIIRERVFFEFYKDYKRDTAVKMALSVTDIRAFIYAVNEVVKTGQTQWKKITENNGVKKYMTLTKNYLNATDGNIQISIRIENIYELLAFRDDLKAIVAETERLLWEEMRKRK